MLRRFNPCSIELQLSLRRPHFATKIPFSSIRCCSASTSSPSLAPFQQQLLQQLPKGWSQIQFQAPVEITLRREADEDGVVSRSEEEHRRIFTPYATSSPFSGSVVINDGSKKENRIKKKNAQEDSETNNGEKEDEEEEVEVNRRVSTHDANTNANSRTNNSSSRNSNDNGSSNDPSSTIYISKSFSFGQFGALYHWMGRVGAMAEQIGLHPDLDWFFLGVTATVPLTRDGLHLAWYMTDDEAVRAANRNTSDGGIAFDSEKSLASASNNPEFALPAEMKEKVEKQAIGEFCWLIAGDTTQRELFTSEVYLQWYHRADYLVSRKAKEATEYRNNLTLEQVLQSASQNRKRRRERKEEVDAMRDKFKPLPDTDLPPQYLRFRSKKERDTARNMQMFGMDGRDGKSEIRSTSDVNTEDVSEMAPSRHQFVIDTLPREIRERLDADDDGNSAHGFGGGVRQLDPVAYSRSSNPSGMTGHGGNLHSGGSWH